ncbi:piggyBac transposable element-derived protein 4-like [Salvelinus sp. IW2-2015]|uniref:piggyBac transposable element-derived protein 4-like n=1 Tax=Salvelinus sp. IW2-2015 TaxID=2691554 RepID=UPI0038D3ADC3
MCKKQQKNPTQEWTQRHTDYSNTCRLQIQVANARPDDEQELSAGSSCVETLSALASRSLKGQFQDAFVMHQQFLVFRERSGRSGWSVCHYLYNPGPEVTVDEQLVPFRGRSPFRLYVPSKPAKHDIKIWVACDTQSSYAWKMQVYTGKPPSGGPEKNQGMRVVLDVTDGLRGHNPELPPALLTTRGREASSSKFAFTPTTTPVTYLLKRNKNVVLLSTLHKMAEISDREDRKPANILDDNHNKGGVDNLDEKIADKFFNHLKRNDAYTFHRKALTYREMNLEKRPLRALTYREMNLEKSPLRALTYREMNLEKSQSPHLQGD